MTTPHHRRMLLFLSLALILLTLALYWPVKDDEFIRLDDHDYITENPPVNTGLTWTGVVWAFRTGHSGNWHPLTWISHMLDCELFGLNPAGHHLMNVMFHALNSCLVLWLLAQLTGAV